MDNKLKIGIPQSPNAEQTYSILFRAFANPEVFEFFTPVFYGSERQMLNFRKTLGINAVYKIVGSATQAQDGHLNVVNLAHAKGGEKEAADGADERLAATALEAAVADLSAGVIDTLVGLDDISAHLCVGRSDVFAILCSQQMRIVLPGLLPEVVAATSADAVPSGSDNAPVADNSAPASVAPAPASVAPAPASVAPAPASVAPAPAPVAPAPAPAAPAPAPEAPAPAPAAPAPALNAAAGADAESDNGQGESAAIEAPYAAVASLDLIEERLRQACSLVRRDYLCSAPRVALIAPAVPQPAEGEEPVPNPLAELINRLSTVDNLRVFGPYDQTAYFAEGHFKHFDCAVAADATYAYNEFRSSLRADGHAYLVGLDSLFSVPVAHPRASDEGRARSLLQAAYRMVDVLRCRDSYDEATANPLPHVVQHDRREDRRARREE